jgi:hypothetical protein
VKQLTVRRFDKDLERRLRDVAKRRGVSLNRADAVGDSLDDLIGSWSKAEESEFLQAMGGLEEIDPSLWR